MRVLVISDVHSNLTALEAVLADAGSFDEIWSLGDIVGYGARPNECIERLCEFDHVAIPGNHDWGVLGKLDLEDFNAAAREANLWSRAQLTPESVAYLESLPETRLQSDVSLAHGSPRGPIWEYLLHPTYAQVSFGFFDTPLCLVGHTHVPVVFRATGDPLTCRALPPAIGVGVQLDNARHIINPGSVGQPRDGDPRAAYLLLDTEEQEFEHRRVAYKVDAAQDRIRQAGLPQSLSSRLALGW